MKARISAKQECLLSAPAFEAKTAPAERGQKTNAWEASTLPLSYTRNRDFHVNFTLKRVQNQAIDSLNIRSSVPTTGTESLEKGYILNCRVEGKY